MYIVVLHPGILSEPRLCARFVLATKYNITSPAYKVGVEFKAVHMYIQWYIETYIHELTRKMNTSHKRPQYKSPECS